MTVLAVLATFVIVVAIDCARSRQSIRSKACPVTSATDGDSSGWQRLRGYSVLESAPSVAGIVQAVFGVDRRDSLSAEHRKSGESDTLRNKGNRRANVHKIRIGER
jgi:hypothetical protein